MIFFEDFIWKTDHYAYHITRTNNLLTIKNNGLIPKCGERSLINNDSRKAIYFFDSLYSIDDWIEALYNNKNIESLELLRFNLKNRKWHSQNSDIGDFYLCNPVLPKRIELLKREDEEGHMFNINDVILQKKLIWESLRK